MATLNATTYHLLLGEHVSLFSKILSNYLENSGLSLTCSNDKENPTVPLEDKSLYHQQETLLIILLINLLLLMIQLIRKYLKKTKPFNPFSFLKLSSSPESDDDIKIHQE